MNDRAIGLLEHYEIEVLQTKKGRGAIFCDTDKGLLVFREYTGNPEKLKLESYLLEKLKEARLFPTEEILPTREETLFTEDTDGRLYFLKRTFEGRECNLFEEEECLEAMRTLARVHNHLRLSEKEAEELGIMPFSQEKEFEKHNKELKKVRRYLRTKGRKSLFESELLAVYDNYLEQALRITEDWQDFYLPDDADFVRSEGMMCHGDYQYHNILYTGEGQAVINFEKCLMDNPIRDICLFLRKIMEKTDWAVGLGEKLLDAYQKERSLSARSVVELYYRLAYPEKFWKIVNFYFNSGKAWIPERNREKLYSLSEKEKAKQDFLEKVFGTLS